MYALCTYHRYSSAHIKRGHLAHAHVLSSRNKFYSSISRCLQISASVSVIIVVYQTYNSMRRANTLLSNCLYPVSQFRIIIYN